MATTSMWAVKDNLKRVLDYASNEEKTGFEGREDLRSVLEYASNNEKTNQLVSGINCSPMNVLEQMKATKKGAGKEDGVQAFHGYQSFAPGEVDAATCHRIGVETAKRMWGENFEVLVCTHTNTDNLHNHFVVNSVSWRTRKRYDNSHADYRTFMKISDDVCKEFGLNIIENPISSRMNYKEFRAMVEGKPYIRGMVKEDVELAINGSRTITQFYSHMKSMGYRFKNLNRKFLTVITPEGTNVRLDKLKPTGYSREYINERILNNEQVRWNSMYDESFIVVTIRRANEYNKGKKYHGLKALYIKYQFMLGILPKNDYPKPVHYSIREDLLYLDKLSREAEFIESHTFETVEELQQYSSQCKNEIEQLEKERHALYSKRGRAKNPDIKEEVKFEIENTNTNIKRLKNEIEMCTDITIRSTRINENISRIEIELEKEKEKVFEVR